MNEEYPIEKGIPILPKKSQKAKYGFEEMEVGDSKFVGGKTPSKISGSVQLVEEKKGWLFKTRSDSKDGVHGVRVWRVK